MALFCPATLHLAAVPVAEVATVARGLAGENVAMVYAAPAAAQVGAAAASLLDVPVRVEAELEGLDVGSFGRGAHPTRHCAAALDDIADLHRGEHVLVVGPADEARGVLLRRLEIGDDGWVLPGSEG